MRHNELQHRYVDESKLLDAKYVAEQKKLTEENALSNSLFSWGATVISNTFTSDKDTLDTLSPELQKNMKLNIK